MLGYWEVVLLGISLAIDASIVAFSYGLCSKTPKSIEGLKIACITSFFQWIMPIIGWLLMRWASDAFSAYASVLDHWIAFVVFGFLGVKIIKDSFGEDEKECSPFSLLVLLFIGFATSIDALAAGVMIFVQNLPLWNSAFLIGFITFVLVFFSYQCSHSFKKLPTQYLERMAGFLLILLGCKIVIEHTYG